MNLLKKSFAIAALSVGVMAAPATADVVVGASNSGNCYPFSCFASDAGVWYQQVYSSTAFVSPVTINAISVFKSDGGSIDGASYTLNFYLTGAAVNGLSTDRASNLGTLLGSFGTFALSGQMPDVLTFSGPAFSYDPAGGNLLLDISVAGTAPLSGYNSFFQADGSGTLTSRAFDNSFGAIGDNFGLVTSFATGAVPEPASWALLITGFGMVGATLRRRETRVKALSN